MITTTSEPASSSLTFGSSCSSKNSSIDALWSDIELAERYLVSNLFEDAANLSLATLHRLGVSSRDDTAVEEMNFPFPWASNDCEDDHQRKSGERLEMIEAAGMVFIQALNELGRVDELVNELVSCFGQVTNVSPSLLVIGISLQVSAGFVQSARLYVEEFLEHFDSKQDGGWHLCNERARKLVADIAEIYAIHMLTGGLMEPESAQKWVQATNLLGERKKSILEKLHALSLQKPGSSTKSNGHGASRIAHSELASMSGHARGQTRPTVTEKMEEGQVNGVNACQNQEKEAVKGPKVLPIRFHILSSSSWLELLRRLLKLFSERLNIWVSNPPSVGKVGIQGRHLAGGLATVLLLYAMFRERQYIKRTMQTYFNHVKSGLYDFWQLAFGLQISPLVASQALPVSSR